MGVSIEATWVVEKLLDCESSTSVTAVSHDTSLKWASKAADRDSSCSIAHRVWESDAWRSRPTTRSLVDVGGSNGWGEELAGHSDESDIETDRVLVGVFQHQG